MNSTNLCPFRYLSPAASVSTFPSAGNARIRGPPALPLLSPLPSPGPALERGTKGEHHRPVLPQENAEVKSNPDPDLSAPLQTPRPACCLIQTEADLEGLHRNICRLHQRSGQLKGWEGGSVKRVKGSWFWSTVWGRESWVKGAARRERRCEREGGYRNENFNASYFFLQCLQLEREDGARPHGGLYPFWNRWSPELSLWLSPTAPHPQPVG